MKRNNNEYIKQEALKKIKTRHENLKYIGGNNDKMNKVEERAKRRGAPASTIENFKINSSQELNNKSIRLSKPIPKRIFFYWRGSNISWMRYMTIYSFKLFNPDWDVILYLSDEDAKLKNQAVGNKQDYQTYSGVNYLSKLKKLNIKIEKPIFPKEVGYRLKNISPIHESDLFRYYQLFVNGGFYCDMDVLFFRPIDNFYNTIIEGGYDTIIHEYQSNEGNDSWWATIGFLGASVNNEYYKNLFELGVNKYSITSVLGYQSMGILLIYETFNLEYYKKISDVLKLKYNYLKFYNISTTFIYNYDWTKTDYCFNTRVGIETFKLDSIGYHWFGGSIEAQKYNNILTENNYMEYNTVFSKISEQILEEKKIIISIVMTYYNRKELFYNTIKSIARSKFTKFEVIVVDDGSSPEHRLEEYIKEFPFLKIIRIEPENKNYVNPCIPFNIGINAALGDIIMLQNPECYHTGDILTHAYKFVNDGNYISYSTYAITENTYKVMLEQIKAGTITTNYLKLLPQRPTGGVDLDGWYNHSIYRPMCYHFCSAISRNNMVKLNGFDERYRDGIGYDDNEFLERIKRLGLNIMIEDDLSVIHQYHETVFYNKPNIMALSEKNMQLFRDMTLKETQIKVN